MMVCERKTGTGTVTSEKQTDSKITVSEHTNKNVVDYGNRAYLMKCVMTSFIIQAYA